MLFTEEIESWKKDNFFETSAVATILKEVRNKSFVVIRGPSGIGKSTIVKLVALQLQNSDGYHILPVMRPEDIVKYLDPNIKQIYIIDDICGKFSVDPSMINSWDRVNRKILKYCKDNKEFRVLGTCRLQISVSSQFRKLKEQFQMVECNLLQKNFLYSKKDKLKIAACHIDEEVIKQLDDKILNAYDMFPLLCMMYAASESNPGVRFFEYPLQAIEEQLDEMNEQNECCFIGLALIVINNNKLYKHLLQNRNDQKFQNVFDDVFEDLGLVNRPSKRSVLSGLQALAGNYTKELESKITLIHDKIFDIFSLYFGKRIPKTILTHGSGTFIAEKFLFESVKEDCDDLKIVIPSELEDSYFNRMVEEIENNRFYNVFKNVQVRNELYQRKFISFLSKHQSIIQKLLYNRWPLYLSAVKGCKLLVQFILNEKRTSGMCNKLDKDGNHQDMLKDKPESDMYACSYDSDSNSESESRNSGICNELDNQDILMDKPESDMHGCRYDPDSDSDSNSESESGSNFDDVNDDGRTTEEDANRIQFENSPMVAACEGGYIDIVKCLVEYDYNIDHYDTNLPAPLFSACRYGNKDVVDFLLKRKCKVDTINKFGRIALHAACENGHIDIVNSLLKCNSSVNLCDTDGYTPLYLACIKGNIDIVNILLKCNSSVNLCGTDGYIPLHFACMNGNIDLVNILLKCNSSVNLCDADGYTPLHLACIRSNIDIVNILLKCNSSVNLCDTDGYTPLHSACINGNIDIVNILLKCNSSVNLCDTDGYTPLHVACRNGNIDIVNSLLKFNSSVNLCDTDGYTPLHVACIKGYKDIVDIFIKLNVDINLRGVLDDHTPIQYACLYGHTDIVKLLLDNNCDVIDNNGFSPALHSACEGGSVDIVDLLLRNKCNINQCQPRTNESPLIVACDRNQEAVVKLLLSYEACDVNIIDCDNCNVLHYACRNGQADVVKLLLSYEACDVNIIDSFNCNALHYACKNGHADVVELLLKRHCNINQCSKLMKTPLILAVEGEHTEVVEMLLRNKCDIDINNKDGHTARDIAVEKHFVDIENILLNAIENTNACGACTE